MSTPGRVGVFGGGRMGAGIAHAFLVSGSAVTVIESSSAAAAAATDRVRASLARADERGQLESPRDEVLTRLMVSTDHVTSVGPASSSRRYPRTLRSSRRSLAPSRSRLPTPGSATNTSSLSIDLLASALSRPTRLIGLHFFNPVPASRLVEIVVGVRTSPELIATAHDWVAELGEDGDHRDRRARIRILAARALPSPSRPCGCSRKASPRPRTSTPR